MGFAFGIAANTIVQLLGKFVSALVSLITTILIARHFGSEGYGDFIKVTSFVALFYLISDFGFNAVFIQKRAANFSKLLTLRLALSLVLVLFAVTLPFFLPFSQNGGFTPGVRLGIIIYSFTIICQALFTTTNALFQKHLSYHKSVIASLVGSLITLFLVAFSPVSNLSLLLTLTMFVIGSVITAAGALIFVREYTNLSLNFDASFIKELLQKTFPIGATLIFNLIYVRADLFLLTLLRNTSEVGIYGLSYKFFEFPLSLPIFFMNSLYPVLIMHVKKDRLAFKKTILSSSIILLFLSIAIASLLFFLAPLLVFIKGEFLKSIFLFRILIVSLPFFFLSSLFQWAIISLGNKKVLVVIYFFAMVINILLNILFIPGFGSVASGIITGVSEGFVCFLLGFFLLRSLQKEQFSFDVVKNINNSK